MAVFRRRSVQASLLGVFVALAGPSAAQVAPVDFYGGGFLTNFSGCEAHGWHAVSQVKVRYRPALVGGNGDTTNLTLVHYSGAQNFSTPGRLDRRWRNVAGMAIYATVFDLASTQRIRLLPGSTLQPRDNTQVIDLIGNIQNFNGLQGCSVDFSFILRRRWP